MLFHKINRPIVAVKKLHFSGVEKWATWDKFARIYWSQNRWQKADPFRLVLAIQKFHRTCFSKCHMTIRHVILGSPAYKSPTRETTMFTSPTVLIALFRAAFKIDLISLLRFPFLSHVLVFSFTISSACHLALFSYFHFHCCYCQL